MITLSLCMINRRNLAIAKKDIADLRKDTAAGMRQASKANEMEMRQTLQKVWDDNQTKGAGRRAHEKGVLTMPNCDVHKSIRNKEK